MMILKIAIFFHFYLIREASIKIPAQPDKDCAGSGNIVFIEWGWVINKRR